MKEYTLIDFLRDNDHKRKNLPHMDTSRDQNTDAKNYAEAYISNNFWLPKSILSCHCQQQITFFNFQRAVSTIETQALKHYCFLR